jgi:hypothetical protein
MRIPDQPQKIKAYRPKGTVGTAFPSGETGYASVSEDPLHTPNKYQPAPVGPPLLEANINYRGTEIIWQGAVNGPNRQLSALSPLCDTELRSEAVRPARNPLR